MTLSISRQRAIAVQKAKGWEAWLGDSARDRKNVEVKLETCFIAQKC
jgi:hypothetical protein